MLKDQKPNNFLLQLNCRWNSILLAKKRYILAACIVYNIEKAVWANINSHKHRKTDKVFKRGFKF